VRPQTLYPPRWQLVLLLTALLAAMNLRADGPAKHSVHSQTIRWQQVGQASLHVLWFHIYDARLETASGSFEDYRQPLRLSLRYKRNIGRDELLAETDKQLKSFATPRQRDTWIRQLQPIWPDIRKGDELIFQSSPQGGGFYHNGVWRGTIDDPAFAPAFVQIWLSERSEYPRLARQLRGEIR